MRVHFQEDGCTYSYGIICLHANGLLILLHVSRLYRLFILLACKQIIPYLYVYRFPEDELSGSKYVDVIKIKILVQFVWFVLYDYITVQGAET